MKHPELEALPEMVPDPGTNQRPLSIDRLRMHKLEPEPVPVPVPDWENGVPRSRLGIPRGESGSSVHAMTPSGSGSGSGSGSTEAEGALTSDGTRGLAVVMP